MQLLVTYDLAIASDQLHSLAFRVYNDHVGKLACEIKNLPGVCLLKRGPEIRYLGLCFGSAVWMTMGFTGHVYTAMC